MAIPNQIKLTGTIYIKYIDDISASKLGDIMLLLNDDAVASFVGDYENTTNSGYIKAKLYDGKVWQNIDIAEFCANRENKFAKKQRSIDSAILCRAILESSKGVTLFRTYRGHFTINQYEPSTYERKPDVKRRG